LITLAAGCFWGVERVFTRQFKNKGLVDIKVGYANGIEGINEITYEKVCSGSTNFVESVQISYEPSQLSLQDILGIFFRMHDATTVNRQGNDTGTQYRSGIFYHYAEDGAICSQVKEESNKIWYPNHQIVTIIEPIKIWYDAEDYHQTYLDRNPGGYECANHFIRTTPKA
jgi:peptide-methionine (S)-S-oxide reductase